MYMYMYVYRRRGAQRVKALKISAVNLLDSVTRVYIYILCVYIYIFHK